MTTLFFENMSPSHRSIRATYTQGAGYLSTGTNIERSLPVNMIVMADKVPLNSTEQAALEATKKARELFAKAVDINTRINKNIDSKIYPRARELINDNKDEIGNLTTVKTELGNLSYAANTEEVTDYAAKVKNMLNNADKSLKLATGETKLAEGQKLELADINPNSAAKKAVVAHLRIKMMDKNDYDLYFTEVKVFDEVYNKL